MLENKESVLFWDFPLQGLFSWHGKERENLESVTKCVFVILLKSVIWNKFCQNSKFCLGLSFVKQKLRKISKNTLFTIPINFEINCLLFGTP